MPRCSRHRHRRRLGYRGSPGCLRASAPGTGVAEGDLPQVMEQVPPGTAGRGRRGAAPPARRGCPAPAPAAWAAPVQPGKAQPLPYPGCGSGSPCPAAGAGRRGRGCTAEARLLLPGRAAPAPAAAPAAPPAAARAPASDANELPHMQITRLHPAPFPRGGSSKPGVPCKGGGRGTPTPLIPQRGPAPGLSAPVCEMGLTAFRADKSGVSAAREATPACVGTPANAARFPGGGGGLFGRQAGPNPRGTRLRRALWVLPWQHCRCRPRGFSFHGTRDEEVSPFSPLAGRSSFLGSEGT